jgi:hypothetical protein
VPDQHLPPQWRERLLALLNAKVSPENLRLLSAWARVEGGAAVMNPLNTTYGLPGSTHYNELGVRNYRSATDLRAVEGIVATALTLTYKPSPTSPLRYGGILGDLQAGAKTAEQIVTDRAANFRTWSGDSTGGYEELLLKVLSEIQ